LQSGVQHPGWRACIPDDERATTTRRRRRGRREQGPPCRLSRDLVALTGLIDDVVVEPPRAEPLALILDRDVPDAAYLGPAKDIRVCHLGRTVPPWDRLREEGHLLAEVDVVEVAGRVLELHARAPRVVTLPDAIDLLAFAVDYDLADDSDRLIDMPG
jgi:hypothetical protein